MAPAPACGFLAPISENGRVVKVRGTLQDITEIKKAELALRASERRLRAMMELNPDWVKVVGAKGELTEMNKAGLDMLEAPRLEDAHMQPLLNYVEPDYRGGFWRIASDSFGSFRRNSRKSARLAHLV